MLRIPTVVLLGLLLLPVPVLAQGTVQKPATGGQAAKNATESPRLPESLPMVVSVNARDCRRLLAQRGMVTLHQPGPDVNYQPGRDVDSQGRPIAPADLPGGNPLPLDGMIELPIRMPLSAVPGLQTQLPPGIGDESKLRIATLAVDPMTGRFTFNGKAIEPPAEDALAVACRDYLAKQPATRR